MADSALGSALIIPKSALEAIKRADERIQSIQDHSRQMGQTVNSAFTSMTGGARMFTSELDKIISKLATIDSKASKMSGSLSNLGAEKAAQQVGQMNNVVVQTAENIDRMAATQRKATNSADFSKSVTDWQNIQAQIDATNKRQQELTQSMRQYELVQQRIKEGKGGIVYKDDKVAYAANQKEFETNQQLIASLREKQQAIIANNQAINQQIQLLNSLKSYKLDSGSLDNLRSKDTLAAMREYYKEQEKLSAKQEKQRQKEADAWLKNKEKEAKAAEKASQREQAASEKAAAKAEKDAARIRAAQEKAYLADLLKQQQKAYYSNTNAVVADTNSAKTLRDHVAAIKELQQARLNLDTTDKNYKQNLASVNEAIKQHSKVLKEAGVNARNLGEQTSYMAGYIQRWGQRMALAFSVGSIKSFIEQVAEVRGQFELSERSLEAILQNKPKADEIFNKTVELAVKSPFRIKDLVDYTRKLSAYRIESDKLYDTTKRLADVSAGLGVDMGRLILAYGQVKAAAYLRGSEVRQFTEAGINMYGELQALFKERDHADYTTAQIVDMISKRMVTFKDVEEVFRRMTDSGGLFYNMQEEQAQTLAGRISNLKDSIDVMFNSIGKENQGTFNTMIDIANSAIEHWREVGEAILGVASAFAAVKLQQWGVFSAIAKGFSTALTSIKTFSVVFMATFEKFGAKAAFSDAITSGVNGITTAFKAMKTALAGIAFVAVVQGLWDLYSAYSKYKDEVSKANSEYVKEMGYISSLRDDFNNLTTEVNKADEAQNRAFNKSANIEGQRKALQRLVDYMNKQGFDIKINVESIDEDKLQQTFNALTAKYQKFQNDILIIQKKISDNKFKNNWYTLSDDINTDAKDYTNSVLEILSKNTELDEQINNIKIHYGELSASAKKYYNVLAAGKKEGETDIAWYTRAYNAMVALDNAQRQGAASAPEWLKNVHTSLVQIGNDFKDMDKQKKEFQSELDDVFGYLDKKGYDKQTIQLILDRTAADNEWSQYAKEMAYKRFDIPVHIDKTSVQDEIDWVSVYIADFFKNKKYGINLSVEQIDDTQAVDDWMKEGDKQAKIAKDWNELITRLKKTTKDTLPVAGKLKNMLKGTIFANATDIKKTDLMSIAKERLRGATTLAKNGFGVDPFEDKKKNTKAEKAQRDLLQERINLLNDMNKKYNDLIKTESKERALSDTRKYFKEAAQNVGWNANDILPDDKTTAKRIREIGAQYKELTKRGNAFRISADIDLKVSEKEYNKLKDDISRNIDDAFSQMKLYKKLKDEGMSDGLIKSMFGDLTKSFDEIQEDINNEFNKYIIKDYEAKYGEDFNKWGDKVIQQYNSDLENTAKAIKQKFADSDVEKDYLDKTQKLNQSIEQDTIETAQRLFKEYKQRLSDQLQLDKKYVEDRAAIMKNFSDPETQKELLRNLELDYKKKSGENTWKDFQNSDMYVRLFDNLDQVSTKALDAMYDRLSQLRTELKDLDPTELKTIAEQINKVNEVRNSRNPFKAFTSGLKEMAKASKELKKLGGVDKYVGLNTQKADITTKLQSQNAYVESLEQEYNDVVKNGQAETENGKALKLRLTTNKQIRDSLKSQLNLTDEQIAKLGTIMTEEEQAKAKFAKSVTDITSVVSTMASSFNGLFEALGGSDAQLENAMSIVDNVGSAIGSYFSGNWAGVASGVMGVATGIAKLFSNEGKIDKEIERQERAINSLQHSYSKLKQSMDDAFDTQRLYEYNQKSVETLKAEQSSYEAMIKAEQGRKNPDDSKIQEWRQQIDDLNDTIKELEETMTEQLGGFGSQSNYKSAAEAFAEAWVDAFNEGSDALEALNDKFDEYIQNLIVKQATQRVVGKLLEPLLTMIDDAVSEGSEGGNNGLDLTKTELAAIKERGAEVTKAINETLTNLTDVLEYKPKGSSNISALQQGIQSVTESTASAIESIMNSMRFYLATQQADVRMIRDTLLERLGTSINSVAQDSNNSPVLVELRLQTTILSDIRDTLNSCVKTGHKVTRKGFGVFMN